jgi:hypothetical protein
MIKKETSIKKITIEIKYGSEIARSRSLNTEFKFSAATEKEKFVNIRKIFLNFCRVQP